MLSGETLAKAFTFFAHVLLSILAAVLPKDDPQAATSMHKFWSDAWEEVHKAMKKDLGL